VPTEEAVAKVNNSYLEAPAQTTCSKRFLPLDAFRGLIILLLVSDGFGFRASSSTGSFTLSESSSSTWTGSVHTSMT